MRYYYLPKHPKASKFGHVAACDLGEGDLESEAKSGVQISVDRHWENTQLSTGDVVNSRRQAREVMRAKGLVETSDYKNTWARAEKERADHYAGRSDTKERREAIGRAMYELDKRRHHG